MTEQPTQAPPQNDMLSRARAFIARLTPRQKLIGAGAIVAVLLLLFAASGAGGRQVTLNGYRLAEREIAYLDAMVGVHVPNGDYWLDPQTAAFGVVGNPQPLGMIGYNMGAQPPHWADVGQNYRGPFGDYMSDGQCSFVNEVPVGNC
jgi:hypothetical protein